VRASAAGAIALVIVVGLGALRVVALGLARLAPPAPEPLALALAMRQTVDPVMRTPHLPQRAQLHWRRLVWWIQARNWHLAQVCRHFIRELTAEGGFAQARLFWNEWNRRWPP
jgi:hypothetical protein